MNHRFNSHYNEYLKRYARRKGVPIWMIAGGFHRSESYFFRMLRTEFSEQQAQRFIQIVDEIAADREAEQKAVNFDAEAEE